MQNLKAEVNTLTQEKKRLHEELLAQPLIGPILIGLFQIGVNEQDIINMAYIFQRHADGGSSITSISIDTQTLIAELQKYGSIKSTIEQLGQEADKLTNRDSFVKSTETRYSCKINLLKTYLSGLTLDHRFIKKSN